jgi:hypothetical protein
MSVRRIWVVNPSSHPAAYTSHSAASALPDCGIMRAVNSAFLVKVLKNNNLSLDFFCKVLINKD